jgi:hypothetical protein
MATGVEANEQLRDTNGFRVETPDGKIGWVEEIWAGEADEPRALAVQTSDGRRALLLPEEVVAVDGELRRIAVRSQPTLLELDAPHLTVRDQQGRMAASWATTGALLDVPPSPDRRYPRRRARPRPSPGAGERPVWHVVVALYLSLALIAVFVIAVAFAVAKLVTGAAY